MPERTSLPIADADSAQPSPRAELISIAASLARLSFFAGEDADKISDQSHDNVTQIAMRIKRVADSLPHPTPSGEWTIERIAEYVHLADELGDDCERLEHDLLATAAVLRGIVRDQLGADFIDPEVGGALAVAAHMDTTQLARFLAAELREPGSWTPSDAEASTEAPPSPQHPFDGGLEHISGYYGVPAQMGGRVVVNGEPGVIVGARDCRLLVQFDGWSTATSAHPTWNVEYVTGASSPQGETQ